MNFVKKINKTDQNKTPKFVKKKLKPRLIVIPRIFRAQNTTINVDRIAF